MAAPKRLSPAQIINRLRKAEVALANGNTTKEVCRDLGVSDGAALLAYTLGRAGRTEAFQESIESLRSRVAAGTATWTELALAYVGASDHEAALDCLEKAPKRPPGGDFTAWLGAFPQFDPIRDHPRFQQVLKRLGLQ